MLRKPPPPSAKEQAWLAGNALLPALIAASQLNLYPGAGRDDGVVRGVGLGYSGGFRALDAWLSAGFAALPLGTRTLRAELPGVLLLAVVAALTFVVVRRALVAVTTPTPWSSFVATIAAATLTLSYPFQHEATNPSSSLLGVALVLATLAIGVQKTGTDWPLLVCLSALGLSYDPGVGACIGVVLLVGAWVARASVTAAEDDPLEPASRVRLALSIAVAAILGLVPFVFAVVHARVSALSTSASPFMLPPAAGLSLASGGAHRAFTLVVGELGEVLMILAVGGGVWGLVTVRGRRENLPLVTLTVLGTLLAVLGGAGTREGWTPVGLVLLFGWVACAAIAMQEGVLRVARARLPLASASAAMVVLLESAFPAIMLDDGLTRAGASSPLALPTWEDTAWSGIPSGSLVLVSSARLYTRLLASRASGTLPGDLTLLPIFDPKNEASASALAHDERLVPLFRDIALSGVPQELSLSTISTVRPLALATDPRWDRTITRHLLPEGLLALFEPEPRGGADRKRALEESAPARARLATVLASPAEAPLAALTTAMLLDRAIAAIQTGEREVALLALTDAATFSPGDTRIPRLIFKESSARGPVDAHELVGDGLAGGALK